MSRAVRLHRAWMLGAVLCLLWLPTSAAFATTRSSSVRPHGARRIPHTVRAATPSTTRPTASPSATGPTAPLLHNFNGVSSRDSGMTNFGLEFEPPDQGLCVGNGYVLEMVNSAYTVYKPNGSVVSGPYNVNGPFDEGLTEFTSDPRCYYDASDHTWYATILWISSDSTQSRLDIAVNTSGDPTTPWTTYRIDTTAMGGSSGPKDPGCPCFGDQPTLGIDAHNLYVTTNEYSITGPQYNGAQIYVVPKSDLVMAGPTATPAHFAHLRNLSIGGTVASSIQPALTDGSAPAEYFLSSLDPNGTFDQRIGLWALTNAGKIDQGVKPTLTSTVLGSEAYGLPPAAQQKGTDSPIDSGDDRMQQVQYIDGHVWGELTTAINLPNDSAVRAGAAWFEVKPALSDSTVTGAITRQGYVAKANNYVLYPALQTAPDGKTVMAFSITGADRYPSAAYAVLNPGSSTFGPITVAAAGTGHYDPNSTRWGDYSWAVLDPSGNGVWGATEYIPPVSSQTADRASNWGTRVFEVATP